MYYRSITENKNNKKHQSKKQNLFGIKQNIFQELTTRYYHPMKYEDNEDNFNNYIQLLNIKKNNEENIIPNDDIINEQNFYTKKNIIINRNKKGLLPSKNYNSKSKNNTLTIINSNSMNNNIFNEENDLMYIISKIPNKRKNKIKEYKHKDNNIIAHLALPFCHYHKFNLKLPKKYTCNFKNCSCCRFKENQYSLYSETKETSRDYIYPSIERSIKRNSLYNNVLDKFISRIKKKRKEKEEKENRKKKKKKKLIKKNIDDNFNEELNENNNEKMIINLKKGDFKNEEKKNSQNNNNSLNSLKSDEMSNISFNFQKPDETNLKIPKKNFADFDKSLSKSLSLEMPDEIKIKDEKDLKYFKNLVDENKKKSKIHFSIAYYQKLNKSYKIYCNNNNNKKKYPPGKSKEKKIEFMRYD